MHTNDHTLISNFAKQIRLITLQITHKANASHVGGVLSMADVLAVLYARVLNIEHPKHPQRDRFFLSKGHACAGLYAALALKGFINLDDLLSSYGANGSPFITHAATTVPGVELSTGSLGHAAGVACGVAYAARLRNQKFQVYVMLSDGELDEGSNWEAFLFASHHALSNITFIIDYNKIQSLGNTNEVIRLEPLRDKMVAFGFQVHEIDGHDIEQILNALNAAHEGKPKVIIAHTIKGKGVDFMENQLLWHYKSPSEEQMKNATLQINNQA